MESWITRLLSFSDVELESLWCGITDPCGMGREGKGGVDGSLFGFYFPLDW